MYDPIAKSGYMVENLSSDLLRRKISSIVTLPEAEGSALARLPMKMRVISARQDIACHGDRPSHCCLVLTGFAFRYKSLSNGQRQILNFHVPGDMPDLQSLHLPRMDHSLAALTTMTAGFIAHNDMHDLNARYPLIAGALWRDTLVDAAVLRERIVSVAQRDGLSRIAHFLCEVFTRLGAVGLANDRTMTMPITQVEVADALGLSPVHVNRMLMKLRRSSLVSLNGQSVTILNWGALVALGDFDPDFLHLKDAEQPTPP